MKPFTHTFTGGASNTAIALLSHELFGDCIIGNTENGGYISFLKEGEISTSFEYLFKDQKLLFRKTVVQKNGGIVILGESVENNNPPGFYIINADREGGIKSCDQINFKGLNNIASLLINDSGDLFLFGELVNDFKAIDSFFIARSNIDDLLFFTKKIKYGKEISFVNAVATNGSIVVYGIEKGAGANGFVSSFDYKLNQISCNYIIPDKTSIASINDVVVTSENNLLFHCNIIVENEENTCLVQYAQPRADSFQLNTKIYGNTTGATGKNIIAIPTGYLLSGMDKDNNQFVIVLDNLLDIVSQHKLDLEMSSLNALKYINGDILLLGSIELNRQKSSLLVRTNEKFEGCKMIMMNNPVITREVKIDGKKGSFDFGDEINVEIQKKELAVQEYKLKTFDQCDETVPAITHNFTLAPDYLLQSYFLNLSAAGSGRAEPALGIYLRWFLNGASDRSLGKNHIPKGDYAKNTNFYNKKDDFVRIYKVPFRRAYQRRFNLFGEIPRTIVNTDRTWVYVLTQGTFYVSFRDEGKYEQALIAVPDPKAHPAEFLTKYGDSVIEVELMGELSFTVTFVLGLFSICRLEIFAVKNKSYAEDIKMISARREVNETARIVAENIRSVKLSVVQGPLNEILFETYSDFLLGSFNHGQIQFIDQYALTRDDTTAFKRLEDTSKYTVNNSWKKFNDNAYVNVNNYKDRWQKQTGLKEGIAHYISLSENDPLANTYYPENLNAAELTEISLQNFINIASMDFHLARMLGMGMIDHEFQLDSDDYIYIAEYFTEKDANDYLINKQSQHLFLSLPTSVLKTRLPIELELLPVNYGLSVDNATPIPLSITDPDGYAKYSQSRYLSIKSKLKYNFRESVDFFTPNIQFQSSDFTIPVFMGIEHKRNASPDWQQPEIIHDKVYLDTNNIPETQLIFFNDNSPTPDYIDEITQNGTDEYAVYPVNIFSRTSIVSNIVSTDLTTFKIFNALKAPTGLTCQLVQKEDPLLLTSLLEQTWLGNVDITKTEIFCRLTFDYYHIHDLNYRYGNKVQVFHRKSMPGNIIGSITASTDDPSDRSKCIITTADFTYISTKEKFIPAIDTSIKGNFIGANFSYNGVNYIVDDIISINPDGTYPKIILKQIETRNAHAIDDNIYQLQQAYSKPEVFSDKPFLLVENLSGAANWAAATDNKLAFEILLGSPAWPEHTEQYTDSGNLYEEKVKGIWDVADIILSPPQINPPVSHHYEIEFNNTSLPNHPQYTPGNTPVTNSVNWYRGYIRVHVHSDVNSQQKRKVLKVEEIQEIGTANKLKIIAIDPDYSATPDENIKTGNSISVNFHPGYKVYLVKDDVVGFNKNAILPVADEGSRCTLVGLRTVDVSTLDDLGKPYSSLMSVPALLYAREIIEPLKPDPPIGPKFATPPDFYNKATYSFTVRFLHKPWGLLFFRTDINKILSCLYEPATIITIKNNLPPVKDDANLEERWSNLLSFDYTSRASDNGDFRPFEINAQGDLYKFPKPDRADIFKTSFNAPFNTAVIELIKDAIYSNLLPLTEQPLIFKYIKGNDYVPQPRKQNILDASGKVLDPLHPDFAQAPMAKKISDTQVLFTDFTLDSNMSSDTAYFYLAREMSNSMQLGKPSGFFGPVQLINTKAPEALNIRKIEIQIASVYNNFKTAVIFEINKFSASQEISAIQILRASMGVDALSPVDVLSPRTMKLVKEIDCSTLESVNGTLTVKDDFITDPEIPFGMPLYYKLIGVRIINYTDEGGAPKMIKVFSEPTKTCLTNVIDNQRPGSPFIETNPKPISIFDGNDIFHSITFHWTKTCYSGKYTLSFLNEFNVWKKIFELTDNSGSQLSYVWDCHTLNLPKKNVDGKTIYYKFKVDVENTAGLTNKESNIYAHFEA